MSQGEYHSLALHHGGWERRALRSRRGTKPQEQRHQCRDPPGLPLALGWAADGHTRIGRRSPGACTTLITRAHFPVGVLQTKAWQCWLPRRAELSWKSKYGARGSPTPAPRAGRGSCAVGHLQHPPPKSSCLHPSRWAAGGMGCPLQRETARRCWLERSGSMGRWETSLQDWG